MKEERYRNFHICAESMPLQGGGFKASGTIEKVSGMIFQDFGEAGFEKFDLPDVFPSDDAAIEASLAHGRTLIDWKAKAVQCKNKARWWFYSDKFLPGRMEICTTCLLAFLESHVSYAVLIRKPWLLRSRCRWTHERDHAGMVLDKLPAPEIIEDAPGVVVGFRAGKALYVVVPASLGSTEFKFEIQTRLTLTQKETEKVREKSRWLAEKVQESLEEMVPRLTLNSIRVRSDEYVVCLTAERGVHALRFSCDLVNDMTDSAKPHPETKAKFNALLRSQLSEVQRYLRLGL